MKSVLACLAICFAIVGCSQTAGGDISTTTEISPTTNFQLDSDFNGQDIPAVD